MAETFWKYVRNKSGKEDFDVNAGGAKEAYHILYKMSMNRYTYVYMYMYNCSVLKGMLLTNMNDVFLGGDPFRYFF